MVFPFEWRIGLRYLRAKRRNHFISFISLISFLGIALGILALITILSIMNGFHEEIRSRMLSMTAHMTVSGIGDKLDNWQQLAAEIKHNSVILAAAPNVSRLALVANGGRSQGAQIKGILPDWETQVSHIGAHFQVGSLSGLVAGEFSIILGKELASSLGVSVGDKVTLVTPEGANTAVGFVPKMKRFKVVGLFEVGMHEYDGALAYIHLEDAQVLFGFNHNEVSGLQLNVSDMFDIPRMREGLSETITRTVYVSDWTQQHANFFAALQLEKRMMFIGLALIVMVAAFNIISTMVMAVTDKRSDIAILRTLGASPLSIMTIFVVQGMAIGLIGMLLGVAGGVGIALNIDVIVPFLEHLFGFKFFPANVFYISFVPSHLEWSDVWQVSIMTFVLTLLATLYPAWQAAQLQPAEALRYE
jgi:lipoprotein-releasing system permease protein